MGQNQFISEYMKAINALYSKGITTEHSFRGDLSVLLEKLTNYTVVNEATRIDCGAPDLTLLKNNIPVGYVEAKDIGKNLNDKSYRPQFDRYKKALDNLIITDYLTFQLYEGENFVTKITIGKILPNKIEPVTENFIAFSEMIKSFSFYNGKVIKDSRKLAEFMAAKTQLLAEVIEKTITDSDENSSLKQQLKDFQKVLLPTMNNAQFADIYAQTIAYGMFVARLQDSSNSSFTRQQAATLIPKSNPFLRNLFQYIAGYDLDENIRWLVDSLADMFNYVDTEIILKEFISKDKDPFLHFYEDFLTKYDKTLKNARGAYYTPLAVVKFIVQAVDDILQTDFHIEDGLADKSKLSIKTGGDTSEYHRVQILDPATGTGTFLAEVVRNIYRRFENNAGKWNDYVRQHLIPRLNGFELMMAPYTMAHLKLEMILQEFGYNAKDTDRLHVYLTDSLENPKPNIPRLGFAKWLSDEAVEAEKIKNNVPVMVILGNPPYSVSSVNNGNWITGLMTDYKKGLNEKNIQPLSDDYIKFIRFGQHYIEKNGEGILAYISNNSFIDGLIHRQMRKSLMETFDKIYILDLHGNAKKKEVAPDGLKDDNVFDIMQGVSINIFVKTEKKNDDELAKVFYFDLFGKRTEKYNYLIDKNINNIRWKELNPDTANYFFVPKDFSLQKEYERGFSITDLFRHSTCGVKTHDDTNLVSLIPFEKNNQLFAYRPFDIRYINYDLKKVKRHRYDVMQHFLRGENIGLLVSRQCVSDWRYVFVTQNMADINLTATAGAFGGGYIFPLYLYWEHFGETEKAVNLNKVIVSEIIRGFPSSITPEQIFDYIYAVLHSPLYREKYKEFLKIDFPHIPYPENAEQFNKLAAFGEKLRHLHLMENIAVPNNFANFPKQGSNTVENSFTEKSDDYHDNKVWINDSQYFDNVPEISWNFYIGGYQPAKKWLKDRKGRTLSYEDIEHYQKMIFVLNETDKIMKEIDLISQTPWR
jgi:type I restriction-modification system DNA methylase subunit